VKKISIYIKERQAGDFILYEKGGDHITPICAGKEIEWSKRGIIEASLQLNKALGFTVRPLPKDVTVTVFQKSNPLIQKEFMLEMNSEELFVTNIEKGIKKIEKFIFSIEKYFEDLMDASIEREVKYTIGGRKQ